MQVIVLVVIATLLWPGFLLAQAPSSQEAQVEKAYLEWQGRWQENATNTELAWRYARACFEAGDLAQSNSERARYATDGIEACREAIRRDPKLGPAHYYLAMNLGERARTDKLAALGIIREMQREFIVAIELAPTIEFAGPHRSLGLLYRDAPGWPTGVGNSHKARQHLLKAVEIAPEFPENWLVLLETYSKWGEKDKVLAQIETVQGKLQAARKRFAGEEWKWSWDEWDQRWEKVKARAAVKVLHSPRTSGR